MQTIKTGVVVALLLAVCYGAFVALNAPDPELPDSIKEWASGEADIEQLMQSNDFGSTDSSVAILPSELISGMDSGTPEIPSIPSQYTNQGTPGGSLQTPGLTGSLPAQGSPTPSLSLPSMPSPGQQNSATIPAGPTLTSTPSLGSQVPSFPALDSPALPDQTNPALENSLAGVGDSMPMPNVNIPPAPSSTSTPPSSNQGSTLQLPGLQLPSGEPTSADLNSSMQNLANNANEAIGNAQQDIKNTLVGLETGVNQEVGNAQNLIQKNLDGISAGLQKQKDSLVGAASGAANGVSQTLNAIPAIPSTPNLRDGAAGLMGQLDKAITQGGSNTLETINQAANAAQNKLVGERQVGNPIAPNLKPPTTKFEIAREQAIAAADRGELKDALEQLTPYFGSPELSYAEATDLVDILDALSREVVYSKRHLLEPPHIVRQSDTVASVAEKYDLNPELLTALNGLGESKALVPGSKLKVFRGPVNASVSLGRQELTLFIGNLYAGRFPVSFGKDPAPREGTFEVVDRQTKRTYYGIGATVLQPTDPRNPYGGFWLNLGDDLCIHGTAEMASSELNDAGCISLAPLDAKHVYSILSLKSRVAVTQ